MELKNTLTNEEIAKRFEARHQQFNQFDLVNYSIRQAEQMIRSGRAPRVKIQTENAALIILDEILKGKDVLEEPEEKKEFKHMAEMPSKRQEAVDEEIAEDSSGQEKVLSK